MKRLAGWVALAAGVLLFAAASFAADGDNKEEGDAAKLKDRIAALEKRVAELESLVKAAASREELKKREQDKLRARMEALADALARAGDGAKNSPDLKELLSFVKTEDEEMRAFLAGVLARLPKELVGDALIALVNDDNIQVAASAITALGQCGDDRGKDAVAARMEKLALEASAPRPGMGYFVGPSPAPGRTRFLKIGCNYLVLNNDARGIDIFVKRIAEEVKRRAFTADNEVYSAHGLLDKEYLAAVDDWTGGKADMNLPKAGGGPGMGMGMYQPFRPEEVKVSVDKLLSWWEKNKKEFKLPVKPKNEPEMF